ncbi:Caffeoylshikimate esterase, partial [Mucuna pruriens]
MAREAFILKESALLSVRAFKSLLLFIWAVAMLLLLPFRGRKPGVKDDCHRRATAVVRMPAKRKTASVALARRELAIRRVREDDDQTCVRDFCLFGTKRGDTIFTQSWKPLSKNIRYVYNHTNSQIHKFYVSSIILIHFLFYYLLRKSYLPCAGDSFFLCMDLMNTVPATASNSSSEFIQILYYFFVFLKPSTLFSDSGRYSDFAKQLNANGYKVYGMDWIGHGGSDGLHAYVHSLEDAVSDMKVFLEKILNENHGLPCFCYGHSTGAAIILKALLEPKVEASIVGATFTSPAVGVEPSHPILVALAPILSFLLPTYQCKSAYKKGLPVSRDPEALIAKYSDPLVFTGSLRVRTGYEILRITTYLQENLRRLRVPFQVLHGTADSVTDPDATQKMYEQASSTDKSIKLYEGFSHDLLFEPEREDITHDIIQWLNSRI